MWVVEPGSSSIVQKTITYVRPLLVVDSSLLRFPSIACTPWCIVSAVVLVSKLMFSCGLCLLVQVPGLYKIFDEILVNAADNKQRDPSGMTALKVTVDPASNTLSVWNNGRGIPVEIHKEHNIYVPELIFGHLLTSSNYDDDEKKGEFVHCSLLFAFSSEVTLTTRVLPSPLPCPVQ
jgi:hypothetical protein